MRIGSLEGSIGTELEKLRAARGELDSALTVYVLPVFFLTFLIKVSILTFLGLFNQNSYLFPTFSRKKYLFLVFSIS